MRLDIGNGYYLTGVRKADKEAYLEHLDDGGEISAYMPIIPYPYTEEVAEWWVRHRLEFTRRIGREISFAIRNPEDRLIGAVGAEDFTIGESHRAEVSFWLARGYRRRGIMTAALRAFVRYAFECLEVIRLTAHTLDCNTASAKVLEKNGFRLEGCLRKHTRIGGALFDTLAYGLLEEDGRIGEDVTLITQEFPSHT